VDYKLNYELGWFNLKDICSPDLNSQPNDNDFSQLDLINSRELSQKLGISAPTLFRWRKKGKIPYLRLGESIKYNLADVIKAIEVRRGL
jgi:excisionase family DNA binding protein